VQYVVFGSKGLKMIEGWKCVENQMTQSISELIYLKEKHQFEITTNLKCVKRNYSTESGKLK
jgi:hypothetical protein